MTMSVRAEVDGWVRRDTFVVTGDGALTLSRDDV